jgi:hypothetical protein
MGPAKACIAVACLTSLACSAVAAVAPIDCAVSWSLSTRGVGLGESQDHVQQTEDGVVTVSSAFRPSSMLAMFGVDPATREFVFDGRGAARSRTETRQGDRPEVNVWRRGEGAQWQRVLNGTADKLQDSGPGVVIDSTSFPYLLRLGLIAATPGEQTVSVVSKGKIYPATLTVQLVATGADAILLGFRSSEANASAWLDRELRPTHFEFTDEHGTLRGTRARWTCQ